MEVRLDKRFIALGAALAAGSKDTGRPEHELASLTRRQLSLEEFQARFFGRFPYHAVIVPIANMPYAGAQAVGAATNTETCAVPWWQKRAQGKAEGLDVYFAQLPAQLRTAAQA